MVRNTYEVQNLGDLLREKRKKLGLDIKQVADDTKIRAEYIIALEAGDYSKFPASVYAKGFLKKYAKYLRISPERAAAMYRRENDKGERDVLQSTDFLRQKFKAPTLSLTTNKIITLVIVLLLVGFASYIIYTAATILQNPNLALTAPVKGKAGSNLTYTTAEDEIDLAGEIEIGSNLTLNGTEVNVNNLQQFEISDLELNIGENRFQLVAKSQLGRRSVIDLLVIRNQGSTATPPASAPVNNPPAPGVNSNPPTNSAQPLTTEIRIVDREAYVQVKVDGAPTLAQVLPVGASRSFTAQSNITISAPRFDAVQISINGQDFQLSSAREHEFSSKNGQINARQL